MALDSTDKIEVAVVLGGGSALGLAHIGVLAVLEDFFEIKGIVGTSMGAMVGGVYASGKSPEWILEAFNHFKYQRLLNPLHFDFSMKGLFNGKIMEDELDASTDSMNIEDCPIPFCAVAYDIHSRRSILINKGPLSKALRASASLPYVFKPYKYGDYLFLDGGVEYPLPVNFAKQLHPDLTIVAVNVQEPLPKTATFFDEDVSNSNSKKDINFIESLLESVYGNQAYLSVNEIINENPDIVINTFNSKFSFKDFNKADDFYEIGKKAAQKVVSNYLAEQRKYDPLYIYKKQLARIKKSITDKLPLLKELTDPKR